MIMPKEIIFFPQNIYDNSLNSFGGHKFTQREIDVMACRLFGHSLKEIARILNISSYRTPETHMRSITKKVGGSSPDFLHTHVINCGKYNDFRDYYGGLRVTFEFQKSLEDLAKKIRSFDIKFILQHSQEQANSPLQLQLIRDLTLLGLSVTNETIEKQSFAGITVLRNPESQQGTDLGNSFSFKQDSDYHETFFELLNHLISFSETDFICNRFKELRKQVILDINTKFPEKASQPLISFFESIVKHTWKKKWITTFALFILMGLGFMYFVHKDSTVSIIARSNLNIPTEPVFLNRSHLLNEMEEKLAKQKEIQSIILIGGGGSGKTTLARQYARSQNNPIVWEVDAETPEKIITSFEGFASILANSEQDKNGLRDIQDIKDPTKRAEGFIFFVKMKLRKHPGWILIYDNVEHFSDIQNHFPSDPTLWGNGKVILTSKDSHLQHNNQIKAALLIGMLSSNQKYDLFMKIMNHGSDDLSEKSNESKTKEFLEILPPFPLDILVAAYYLKTTRGSYNEYLENLRKDAANFSKSQEDITQESINYKNNRFHIITTSLKGVVSRHKSFPGLLLLISLIDSQNIPRELLNYYDGKGIAESFIFHLQKYSLLTSESLHSSKGSELSIHRSTQKISLSYLTQMIGKDVKHEILNHIAKTFENQFEDIINSEDFSRMNQLISHLETILQHENILTPTVLGVLQSELGYIYYYLGYYVKAIDLLKQSLINLESYPEENHIRKARVLSHLGKVYREVGDYKTAESLLKKSSSMYEGLSNVRREHARTLGYLGYTYRNMEDFDKAEYYLKKALAIYHNDSDSPVWVAWLLAHLGAVDFELGNYEKAKANLEKSLEIFGPTQNEKRTSWVLGKLGRIYQELGDYPKAKELMEQSLKNHQKRFSETHSYVGWILLFLGDVYGELGEFEKARSLCEKSLKIHYKLFGKDNLRTHSVFAHIGNAYINLGDVDKGIEYIEITLKAYEKQLGQTDLESGRVLRSLGKAYLLKQDTAKAEHYLLRGLSIFEGKRHPNSFMIYIDLSEINFLKSKNATKDGRIKDSLYFSQKALNYLKQALRLVEVNFPKDSPHVKRIQEKLRKFE